MKSKSFTLIELLVVIVIIGILAGVIMISTSSSIDKANFAKAQAFSSTVQNELLSNLVSEWTFDEPEQGGKTEDSWGNNDGIVYEATRKYGNGGECLFRGCYEFINSTNYIDTSYNLNGDKTVSLWAKSYSINTTNRMIFGVQSPTTSDRYYFGYISGFFGFGIGARLWNTNDANGFPLDKNWHFYTITSSGLIHKIYIDGIYKGQKSEASPVTDDYYIGNFQYINSLGNTPFDGLIDDIRIYNSALSNSQIKQNYIAGVDSLLSKKSISKKECNERINVLAYE
ncbi:MAG: LamG-like jellyroll fold domain-containing protein [Bacilli bacterium]